MPKTSATKDLLKAAQVQILALQEEKQSLASDLSQLMEAQAYEAEHMVKLSEQLWKLEEALVNATEDKETAMILLQKFKDGLNRLHNYATDTLNSVKENKDSRLGVAVKVYEMKSMLEKIK